MARYPRQELAYAVIIVMPILSAMFCCLRLYARKCSPGSYGIDDWILVVATIFSFIIIYPSWEIIRMWNMGKHVWEAKWDMYVEPDFQQDYKMGMVVSMVGLWIVPLVKASIIILLLRVGGIVERVRLAVYGLFVFNALGTVVQAFIYLFQCPQQTGQNWAPHTFNGVNCVGRNALGKVEIFYVCFNMLTDLLIFPIPVYLAWKLQKASMRDRIIVVCLFSLSLGVTAIGAVRIYLCYQQRLYRKIPIDWTYSIQFVVRHAENGLAIVFACVPGLRSLILGWLGYKDDDPARTASYVRSRSKSYGGPATDYRDSCALPSRPQRAATRGIEVACLTTFDVESTTIRDYDYHEHREDTRSTEKSFYEKSLKVEVESP